jgi:hypothetical protein
MLAVEMQDFHPVEAGGNDIEIEPVTDHEHAMGLGAGQVRQLQRPIKQGSMGLSVTECSAIQDELEMMSQAESAQITLRIAREEEI